ncbi:hemolysin III family protein [Pontibacterium granulatum]|uniref:PAQR family membrane homeostasis protein TrhA n=1 Tax=Pontibacterium granulatum TaxID=2036029 RepID=UPI00249AAD36|nr:hemolysin III family protein [Pontibacterium granulatum]MDI3324508.1 hemolysin III family protein [Pontibacterium granulatum]
MYKGERFNSITHLIGALAALVGLVVLVVHAARQGDPWQITSFTIYGVSLVLLYVASTLYHSLRGKLKELFRKLDHQAIYLLIAGTYTPFTLVSLRGFWGWLLFGLVWGMALIGMTLEFIHQRRVRWYSLVIYLVMGWLMVIAIVPLLDVLPLGGFIWLLAGGLFYTLGILFYLRDGHMPHAHGIWHLFTMAGSGCHYVSVFFFVA